MTTMLTGLFSNALLARLLSPQDLGSYFLAFSIASLGAMAGSLGLNHAVVRFVAESMGLGRFGRTRRVIAIVLGLGMLGSLGMSFAYLFLGDLLGTTLFQARALAAVTGLIAGWIVAISLQEILSGIFRGFHDIRFATIFGGFGGLGGVAAGVLFIASLALLWVLEGQTKLATVMFLAVSSGCASALLGSWLLRHRAMSLPLGGADSQVGFMEILRVAWPLLVTNISVFALVQADIWILGAFRPQEEVALYGAAARVAALIWTPMVIVTAVVPPLIAEMYAQRRRRDLERTLRFTATLASIPAFLALIAFALLGEPILTLIYGDYYGVHDGTVVLTLLSIGQTVGVFTGACAMTLMMTGHQMISMAVTIATGVLTIIADLGVVDPYGPTGVAAATCGGVILQSVLMWLMARRKTGMWTHFDFRVFRSIRRLQGTRG
jgi:O-antigen/teichoic acid export membrane protein